MHNGYSWLSLTFPSDPAHMQINRPCIPAWPGLPPVPTLTFIRGNSGTAGDPVLPYQTHTLPPGIMCAGGCYVLPCHPIPECVCRYCSMNQPRLFPTPLSMSVRVSECQRVTWSCQAQPVTTAALRQTSRNCNCTGVGLHISQRICPWPDSLTTSLVS